MPKPKPIEEKTVQIEESLLKSLIERLDRIENTIARPITSQAESLRENLTTPVEPAQITQEHYPVPPGYREIVDSVLNKDFGIEVEAQHDSPTSLVTIVVPEKYSRLTLQQKEANVRDVSPKIITHAGGMDQLREWADLVYKNFTPEYQAMIVADRTK